MPVFLRYYVKGSYWAFDYSKPGTPTYVTLNLILQVSQNFREKLENMLLFVTSDKSTSWLCNPNNNECSLSFQNAAFNHKKKFGIDFAGESKAVEPYIKYYHVE